MTHLAATKTLMLHDLTSLQKLVLQVCKRWESVLHRLRDKLFKEDMVCDVTSMKLVTLSRPYQGDIQELLQCFSETINSL